MRLSDIVSAAKKIAPGCGRNYPYAVRVALSRNGFRFELHKTQTISVTRGWKNDIGATDDQTLYEAILAALGREGGEKFSATQAEAAEKHEVESRQFELVLA